MNSSNVSLSSWLADHLQSLYESRRSCLDKLSKSPSVQPLAIAHTLSGLLVYAKVFCMSL